MQSYTCANVHAVCTQRPTPQRNSVRPSSHAFCASLPWFEIRLSGRDTHQSMRALRVHADLCGRIAAASFCGRSPLLGARFPAPLPPLSLRDFPKAPKGGLTPTGPSCRPFDTRVRASRPFFAMFGKWSRKNGIGAPCNRIFNIQTEAL